MMLVGRNRRTLAGVVGVVGFVLFASGGLAQAGDRASEFKKLVSDRGESLVTLKFVLKMSMPAMMGGDQETETDITCVMIGKDGLVLCSNTQLGGFIGMMRQFMGPMGAEITATPKDLKVLIGDDSEGVSAELVARDTELDLAWIRIKKPAASGYKFIDFGASGPPAVGDRVLALRKMGKYFGRAIVVLDGYISGTASKPRDLFIPGGMIVGAMGLPVFAVDGRALGVVVMQAPDGDGGGGNPMAMLGRMGGMQDSMSGFILPASDVVKATQRALVASDDDDEEEEE